MVYTNAVDPNGRLPHSVVSMTVADRAMIVGRLRSLLQAEPAAWADPFPPFPPLSPPRRPPTAASPPTAS